MLERAVRCLENARHYVYLGSKQKIRSRRNLTLNFWRRAVDDAEIPFCCIVFTDSPSPVSSSRSIARKKPTTPLSSSPSLPLEFLYPAQLKSFTRPCLHTFDKRNASHRRRRRPTCRNYSSASDGLPTQANAVPPDQLKLAIDNGSRSEEEMLQKLLTIEGSEDYDKAWELYESIGASNQINSQLLHYLSSSHRPTDIERSQHLFNIIPISVRTERDYLCATRAVLRDDELRNLATEICKEAVSRQKGKQCWDYAIAVLINRMDWYNALSLWKDRPGSLNNSSSTMLRTPELTHLDMLHDRIFSFIKAMRHDKSIAHMPGKPDLAKYMLHHVISSDKRMTDISTTTILRLFNILSSADILEPRHYFRAISTLQLSDIRSANTRSLMLYRDFRSRDPNKSPPERLLTGILQTLSTLEVSEGIEYVLGEYRLFYGKPSTQAYRFALTAFARFGEVSQVEDLFETYVADYGKPSDQRVLTPLLHVYARAGRVRQTRKYFDNLLTEFGVKPNIVCWNILLTAYTKSGDLDGAISTFKEMIGSGISPDSHSFGTMMGVSANRGDVDAVFDLLNTVKRDGIPQTPVMIDTVVEALCNNRNYAQAEHVVEEATLQNPPKSLTRAWNIILWNHAFMINLASVSRIHDKMQERGVEFDNMTYAALMLSLVLVGNTEAARNILDTLLDNQRVPLSVFNYAIVLHGYVKERNPDAVQTLFSEMVRQFGEPGSSSNLAMLNTQIEMDIELLRETEEQSERQEILFSHTERFLNSIMRNFDLRAYATKQPQPGTNKRLFRDAFPSIYYEHLIRAYGSEAAFDKAEDLFSKYTKKVKSLPLDNAVPPLQLLHALMVNYLKKGQYYEVRKCWRTALSRTLQLGRPMNIDIASLTAKESTEDYPNPHSTLKVLPSHRFALSRCLSTYMESLFYQNIHSRIASVVDKCERLGFVLTTKNWSLYINLLCLSRKPEDQLRAFRLFEKILMPNFPGWRHITRGYVKKPDEAPSGLDVLDNITPRGAKPHLLGKAARQAWSKIKPDYMQPTYLTMLHLASALIDFRSRSVIDGGEEMQNLFSKAPNTFNAVSDLPYLRDKFQGILLRGNVPFDEQHIRALNKKAADEQAWMEETYGRDDDYDMDTEGQEGLDQDEDEDYSEVGYSLEDVENFESNNPNLQGFLVEEDDEDPPWTRTIIANENEGGNLPRGPTLNYEDDRYLEDESRFDPEQNDRPKDDN